MDMTMSSTMMAWMMAICVGLLVALVYFAYRYGRMAERLAGQQPRP